VSKNKTSHKKQLQVAFIGGGVNSAIGQTHRIAIELDQRLRLVAGCFSQDQKENQKSALAYGVPPERTYSSLNELLKSEVQSIDAIVILTPTPIHHNDILLCLKHELPVICEKALATSSAEIKSIKETLSAHKGFLVVTYNYTGYPMMRELKQLIRKGKLGNIQQIHIEMPQEGFSRRNREGLPNKPQDWRLKDTSIPTLSLDLGVHLHHIIDFLTEEKPLRLVATQNQFGAFSEVVDNSICIAQYTNSLVCNIWYSKSALGHRNGLRVRVFGSEGAAEWYQADPENLQFNDNKGHRTIMDRSCDEMEICSQDRYTRFKAGHPAGYIEAFANLYWDISDALESYISTREITTHNYVANIDKAYDGLIMLEAMVTSVEQEAWIDLT
jgi:predicted dehydrogenase